MWAFARREAVELQHDSVRLAFAVLGPILLMIVFGYGISLDVDHLPFAVLDSDATPPAAIMSTASAVPIYFDEKRRCPATANWTDACATASCVSRWRFPRRFRRTCRGDASRK